MSDIKLAKYISDNYFSIDPSDVNADFSDLGNGLQSIFISITIKSKDSLEDYKIKGSVVVKKETRTDVIKILVYREVNRIINNYIKEATEALE